MSGCGLGCLLLIAGIGVAGFSFIPLTVALAIFLIVFIRRHKPGEPFMSGMKMTRRAFWAVFVLWLASASVWEYVFLDSPGH